MQLLVPNFKDRKLVSVLPTSLLITMASMEALVLLKCVLCIDYLVLFQKDPVGPVFTIIDLSNKINAMHLVYAKTLSLNIRKTDVTAQKIGGTTLETLQMLIVAFPVFNKAKKVYFFEETFLLADINMNVALKILFFPFSNVDVRFTNWRLY